MVESLVVSLYLKYLLNQTDTHTQTQTHTLKHRHSNTHSKLSTEQTKAQGIGVKKLMGMGKSS